jgi:hypothetical protein
MSILNFPSAGDILHQHRGCRGHDRMAVGFTTTCAISVTSEEEEEVTVHFRIFFDVHVEICV